MDADANGRRQRRTKRRRRRIIRRIVVGVAAAVVIVGAGFTIEAFAVRRDLTAAEPLIARARAAAEAGDPAGASADLQRASVHARRASARARGPFTGVVGAIPLIGRTADAIRIGAGAADIALQAGVRASAATGAFPVQDGKPSFGFHQGRIPVDAWRDAAGPIAAADMLASRALTQIRSAPRTFVMPPVARAIATLSDELDTLRRATRHAAALSRMIPSLAGAGGERSYLLVLQNPAEARATGGLLGGVAILRARDGAIDLTDTQPDNDFGTLSTPALPMPDWFVRRYDPLGARTLWSSVNMEPDFPTTAPLIAAYYTAVTRRPVDGVIAIDPYALSFLLTATGPVVGPHGVTFEASTVAKYVMSDSYAIYPPGRSLERKAVVLDAASVIFDTVKRGVEPAVLARALADAARQKHVQVWMRDAVAQQSVAELGVDGAFRTPDEDTTTIGVVTQNGGANKIDFYLRRRIGVTVRLQPDGSADGTLTVGLRNTAPDRGLPKDVIGPPVVKGRPDAFRAGENVTYLNVYLPAGATDVAWTSAGAGVQSQQHLAPHALITSRFVSIPSGTTTSSRITFRLPPGTWLRNERIRLRIPRQAVVASDELTIRIEPPPGRRVGGKATYTLAGVANQDISVDLAVARTFWRRVRDIVWR